MGLIKHLKNKGRIQMISHTSYLLRFTYNLSYLISHPGFRRYFANTSWLFAEKIFRMVVGFFVGIWVARYLGPEQFGLLSYAQSFVGLFTAIATLGLDGIVVRELVKDPSRKDELIGTGFWLKLIGAIAVLLILAIAVNFTSNDHVTNVMIFIIASATIFQAFNVVDMYFQAKVLSKYIAYANAINLLISSIVKIALILIKAPLIAFAWVVLFDSAVLAAGLVYYYIHRNETFKSWRFSKKIAKELLRESYPMIISFFAISISLKIDQIIIKELLDAHSVGLYAASLRIIELWYFIPVALTQSFFPAIINTQNNDIYQNRIKALSSFLLILSIGVVTVLIISKDFFIPLLFGESYLGTINILSIHSFAIIFVFFASLRKKLLLAENKTYFIMYYSIVTAVIMVVSSYLFIKNFGLIGAPYAYLFTWSSTILVVPVLFGRFQSETLLFIKAFNFLNLKVFYTQLNQKVGVE